MKHTVYAVLTDEELVRKTEIAEVSGSASDLELELMFRLRSRLDAEANDVEDTDGPHT
ncbi:hypothetical protein ACO0LG_08525 [Undibacterium sp. Ji42W]|uniref:hypothetical protein n=1 Tax=Undibacterium sp. Ji42W TaxID=3413039 RepID=UPI003BF44143